MTGFKQYLKVQTINVLSVHFKIYHQYSLPKDVDKELDKGSYYNDGLIFLPMFLPERTHCRWKKVKSIKGLWYQNYNVKLT